MTRTNLNAANIVKAMKVFGPMNRSDDSVEAFAFLAGVSVASVQAAIRTGLILPYGDMYQLAGVWSGGIREQGHPNE